MKLNKNLLAFLVIGGLGTLFHFVYDWTNGNMIIGLFVPVNESIWEHLKLIFYPSLIYFAAEYFITKEKSDNLISKSSIGIYWGMACTVVFYYIYSGVLGKNIDFINILIFFIAVIIVIAKRNKIADNGNYSSKNANIFFAVLLGVSAFLFALFSYYPPNLGIFSNPTI